MNHSPRSRGGVKLPSKPEILSFRRKDIVSRFVKEAIKEEAHLIKPGVKRLSLDGWIRGRNILGSYLLSSATQGDIGKIYSLRQVSIGAQLRNSIRYLWLSASPELQQQFILPHEPAYKVVSPEKAPEKRARKPIALPTEAKPMHPKLREALSGVQFTFIDPKSREFLKQAFTEGAHLMTPPGMNSEIWFRDRNIFGTYILSHASLDEVGNIFGISRERVRQINEEVLEKLFPENKISLKKRPETCPKEWLLVKNSLGSDIVEFLEQGLSPDKIKSRYAKVVERNQADKVLRLLRKLGFGVQRMKKERYNNQFKVGLQREDITDTEIQTMFDQMNIQDFRALVKSGTLILVSNLTGSAGFYYARWRDSQSFYDALIDAGIPLGMTEATVKNGPQKGRRYYYFIASRHKKRAEEALKSDPNLAKFLENPVKQISGPKTNIPNTSEIQKKRAVLSFASVLKEFRPFVNFKGKKVSKIKSALVTDNNLPVFEYPKNGTFYILEADLEKARAFIKAGLESENS